MTDRRPARPTLPAHRATVSAQRAPHPATVIQRRPPHPATVAIRASVALAQRDAQPAPSPSVPPSQHPRALALCSSLPRPRIAQRMKESVSEEDTSYEALMIALSRTEALEGVMATDTTRARDPSHDVAAPTQIAWCLTLCETAAIEHEDARKGIAFSGEFELALCVYTTYFYAVINRALRDLGAPKDRVIAESIERTYDWLMAGFEAAEAVYIRTFRMELQSEWIKDTGVGATVAFPGFTSTHPTLHGINAMPYDVRNGAFGTVTTPVVLVFEGLCKILLPQTKYFPSETEYILPAGIVMKITKCYKLDWYLMSDDHSAPITVLHLEPMYLIDKKGKRGKCEVSPKMLVTPTPAPEGDFGIAVAENGDFVLYKA